MSNQNEPTLLGIAQRILKLENEKAEIGEIIKEVYSEAKNAGYNDKVLKRAIKWITLEEKDQKKILAENEMFDLYVAQMDLPL